MAGIYIHIPFCKQKCSYCDFHFSTTFSTYRNNMIRSLIKEIEKRKDYLNNEDIETIYFGGGTPSLLTYNELKNICETVKNNFLMKKEIEFTLEANPDDISEDKLLAWKSIGVNRLSIGIQSFFQEDLIWMNRAHTVEESMNAVELAQKYQYSLTLDLIYGLPNHTIKELKYNLENMLKLNSGHISAYCLSVEKGTALAHFIKTKKIPEVGEEAQSIQFEYLTNHLKNEGYAQYEISNFAKNNKISIHNSNYWKGKKYIGIGPSAHSFDGKSRRWNIANNHRYIKGVLNNEDYFDGEILSEYNRFNEMLLTGLRTIWGVDLKDLKAIKNIPVTFFNQLEEFKYYNLIFVENDIIYLTEKGKLQADYISSKLFIE